MKPLLLLHGALGASSQLLPLRDILSMNGRNIIVVDFSGHHGRPFSADGFGIEVFARDVIAIMEELSLSVTDVFGYSMGGYVALWLAHKFPSRVNRVITLGTKFDWDPASAEKEVRKMDPEKIAQKVPAFARILERRHRPTDWKELVSRTAGMMISLGQSPLLTLEILADIRHPSLICLGDRDDMADLSYSMEVARNLPRGRFQLLNDTTHPIEALNLQMMTSLCNDFLSEKSDTGFKG